MAKPLRCMVGWHKWVKRYTDDHVRYLQCQRCGTEDTSNLSTPGAMGGGF